MATSYADSAQARAWDKDFDKPQTSHLRRDFDPDLFHDYDAQAVTEREIEERKSLARRKAITMTKMEECWRGKSMCRRCDQTYEKTIAGIEIMIASIIRSETPEAYSNQCVGGIQIALHQGYINQGQSIEYTQRAHNAEDARRGELRLLREKAS